MKTLIWVSVGLLASLFLVVGFMACDGSRTACFRGHGGTPEEKVAWVNQWVTKKLDLNATQQAELTRMLTEMADKHAALHAMRSDFRQDFLDELRKEQLRPEELKQLVESRRPAFEEMLDLAARNLAAFHAMLTPEQREKLVAGLEAHRERCPWTKGE